MKKYLFLLFVFISFSFAQESENPVDCLILEDENSIICKYVHERVDYDKEVEFQWVEPSGNVTRKRKMVIPAYHGSIYDYRYIEGRSKGEWIFRVVDGSLEYQTTFTLK